MSLEIAVVLGLVVLALGLFVSDRVGVDMAALIIMSILLVTGIITPRQGLAGFSNSATVTVTAMFVLSFGLTRTGALRTVGNRFSEIGVENEWLGLGVMMATVATISTVVPNTAVVALFLPIVLGMARKMQMSPSKLLIPLSFASMFGGVCTLIGTSTNILVDAIAQDAGMQAFGVFEFLPLGLVFFVAGLAYLYLGGVNLIPARRPPSDLTGSFRLRKFLTDVVVKPESLAIGESVEESRLTEDLELDVLEVFRAGDERPVAEDDPVLQANDVLRIRGSAGELNKLTNRGDVMLQPSFQWEDIDLELGEDVLVEVVVPRNSPLVNRPIGEIHFPEQFGARVLAVRHHGEVELESIEDFRLVSGAGLLLKIDQDRIAQLRHSQHFVIVSEIASDSDRSEHIPVALGIMGLVIGAAALNLLPIVVSSVAGAVLMVLTGCLTMDEAYDSIQWDVVFLLGGILSLGQAMQTTGAAQLMAEGVLGAVGALGPHAVLSAIFLLTMVLTNIISNNGAAVLLAPIAIEMAETLSVSPRPFLFAIAYGASLAFMTPVGYQTNTLIYGPGQYRFTDFTRVGTPLNILFWLIGSLLIPFFWPL